MGTEVTTALVAAFVSGVIAVVSLVVSSHQARNQQMIAAQNDIVTKYDALVRYRSEHPEVLSLARKWNDGRWLEIYEPIDPADHSWSIYYGYIELITLYFASVLYARNEGLLNADLYRMQHAPLMRLLLAEHYPIFSEIIRPGGYVTGLMVSYVEEITKDWDWKAAHEWLVVPGFPPASTQ